MRLVSQGSSVLVILAFVLVLSTVQGAGAASCMCDAEYEWLFDLSPSSAWITMTVTIHPSGNGLDSWGFTLRPPKASDQFSAWRADASKGALKVTVLKDEEKATATVYFGSRRGDGYKFAVKWLQTNLPDLQGGQLTAEWSWTSDSRAPHIVHIWLPAGYVLTSSTANNSTEEIKDGRDMVTFSGANAPGERFYWSIVAGLAATTTTYSSETSTYQPPTSVTTTSQILPTSSSTQEVSQPLILGQSTLMVVAAIAVMLGVAGFVAYRSLSGRKASTTAAQRVSTEPEAKAPPTKPAPSPPKPAVPTAAVRTPPPGMKFCIHCGQAIPLSARFCTKISCGKPQD